MSVPPPGYTPGRWLRLLDHCRQMDDRHNRGATTGKGALTCDNASEHGFDDGTLGSENEVVRACVNTPDPAHPEASGASE